LKHSNILGFETGTAAVQKYAKLASFDPDGLDLEIEVSGTGHAFSEFNKMRLYVTLKNSLGDDINIVSAVVGDLFKLSDYAGGFSAKLHNDAEGKYYAYIPLGNIMLEGEDSLEVSFSYSGHATAVYTVRLDAIDIVQGDEYIIGYDSLTGNGDSRYFRDAAAVYITSASKGDMFKCQDQMKGSNTVLDHVAIALANELGQLEQREDFGLVWQDGSGLSQNINVTIPQGADVLVVKRYFPVERIEKKSNQAAVEHRQLVEKIRMESPEKFHYLRVSGEI
jgi:hypothetical protein